MGSQILTAKAAAAVILDGGVIAAPTESVYGLSCDPSCETAVQRILSLKQRSADCGLILIASGLAQLEPWIGEVSAEALAQTDDSWPGPTTWLFPRSDSTPRWLCGSHHTIAVRVTDHQPSCSLCDAFGGPVVSTSANSSGEAPARSAEAVQELFGDRIDGILMGSLGGASQPSTIRDLASGRIIRE